MLRVSVETHRGGRGHGGWVRVWWSVLPPCRNMHPIKKRFNIKTKQEGKGENRHARPTLHVDRPSAHGRVLQQ